ncbi:uncharacterized protein LOC110466656 [Mizuhopecten yessoensis]|uniref:Uncharacterized protein n=1 Tax=Mizuhopecten yessoensis TaxID=6573 RepID=A0A210PNR8_MIZYE|nr:uncharacterized protein LOC110466656 [Mizuhopecten yessoensis]OWF38149.1 hypothetical protein KP79_PYT08824 [Mizuhopecten yessoensis]
MCVCKPMADGGAIEDGDPPLAAPTICIDCLLQRTQTRYWRRGLFGMLKPHHDQNSLNMDISFLISNIQNAIEAKVRGPYSLVTINYDIKPPNLDLVSWRRVLVGMELVLEEPDTNFEIRSIAVSIGQSTNSRCLHGLLILLKSLQELHWDLMQMVLHVDKTHGSILFETLTDISMGFSIQPMYIGHIRALYQDNTVAMRVLGFYRRSPEEEITWTQPERRDYTRSILCVLRGLLRAPAGVQASS